MLESLLSHFRADLAVDLGTANTLVALVGEGCAQRAFGRRRAARHRADSIGWLCGGPLGQTDGRPHARFNRRGAAPAQRRNHDFELCEAMLRYFLGKARRPGWRLRPRVLVGAPGCITPVEKRALFNSVHRAGAGQVWIMPEAKAAMVGVGLPIAEPTASMVCDIGGGTTEVAVMSLGDTVAAQSVRTGGDRMDQAIVDYLRRHYSLRIGLSAAERLKIDIGSAYPLEEERTVELSGIDTVSGLPRRATVTSEEVREALGDPLQEILDAIKAALDHCSPDLAADLVDNGLVLCGGGALLRRLDRFIQEQTGLPVRLTAEPLTAVAQGLLICMEHFPQWRRWLQSSEEDV